MAARPGVDLHHGRAGRLDAAGVQRGFLVALDDRQPAAKLAGGALEQRGLSRPRELIRLMASTPRSASH